MQLAIVLCPVDFSNLARGELALAVEVCEAFGARLVLHHNLAAVSPAFARAWRWKAEHEAGETPAVEAKGRMREILREVPRTVAAEGRISRGPLGPALLQIASVLPADLMVLGSHGWSTPDHASVSERVIERAPCPVLTIQEGSDVGRFRLRAGAGERIPVVVPTDLSDSANRAVDYAFALARTAPLDIHLLQVLAHGSTSTATDAARQQLGDLAPDDLAGNTTCHVRAGDPIDAVLRFSQEVDAGFIVMGEHARGVFRRFFTKDTAREVLHQAACPVWFVPGR
jgi:nucleotide-binding universal stress UspA family protein